MEVALFHYQHEKLNKNKETIISSLMFTISTSDMDVRHNTYKETPTVVDWPVNEYLVSSRTK